MPEEDLAFTPAWRLRTMIAGKEISPVELTELYLRRIETLNPELNAYLTVDAERALSSAKSAETAVLRGEPLGLLHGLPISVKDLMYTEGLITTRGSLVYQDFVPDRDSLEVERVRRAGAVIIGKTNTPEFGLRASCENRIANGRNPWNVDRTPGGSSGGAAAAAAAGLAALHLGNDGGGSIRIPAAYCGVFGLKPNSDRIPRNPWSPSPLRFGQAGPISRSVQDSALLMQVLAGPDPRDPLCIKEEAPDFLTPLHRGVQGLRIAWSPFLGFAAIDAEVLRIAYSAARRFTELGATVEEPDLTIDDPWPAHEKIFFVDTYLNVRKLLRDHADKLTPYVRKAAEIGGMTSGVQYEEALRNVIAHRVSMERFMERYDLLLTPTVPVPAYPIENAPRTIGGREVPEIFWRYFGFNSFTCPFNASGQPAATIPCGFCENGLPVGLQIVGRLRDEVAVLRASAAYEEAFPWQDRRPAIRRRHE